jgi:type II secretory pathway pseudopilin PulG
MNRPRLRQSGDVAPRSEPNIGLMPRGWTLIETIIVLCITGLLTAAITPRMGDWVDRAAVSRAAGETASFYATARMSAVFRGVPVRLEFTPDSLAAVLEGPQDSLFLRLPGPAREGVDFTTSRTIVRIYPTGIAAGGSNTTLVFRRGRFEQRITLSRLGRLKRWR